MRIIATGTMAFIYGMLLVGASMMAGDGQGVYAGDFTPTFTPDPTATPDPTFDPCDGKKVPPTCTVVSTQPPRSESTNTPEATDTPAATNTSPPAGASNTPQAPPPTNTPGGGAGAGGVSPPDTGVGSSDSALGVQWYAALGAGLALAGLVLTSYGVRRRR
jgi:hypothetical protein